MKMLIFKVGNSVKATSCLFWILLSLIFFANILQQTAAASKDTDDKGVFVVENSGSGQVIYTASSGSGEGITYTLSVDSVLPARLEAIKQRFVENVNGSVTLQLFVNLSSAYNHADGINGAQLKIRYNADQVGHIAASQVVAPGDPINAVNASVSGEIRVAQLYFPEALSLKSEAPLLEVTFELESGVTSTQFEITDALFVLNVSGEQNRDHSVDFGSLVWKSRYLGDKQLTIDPVTGAVTLFTNPNYESQPIYGFVVTATDEIGNVSEQSITVTVIDIADSGDGAVDVSRASGSPDSDGDGVEDNADRFPKRSEYSMDSDLDFIPDAWEVKYGLDPNNSNDAGLDHDGDGLSALEEFEAGSIPLKLLDIDGNGAFDALTDGLIILRYAFGIRGEQLIDGLFVEGGLRASASEIEAYFSSIMLEN